MLLTDLQTPCLILDRRRVIGNTRRMSTRAHQLGVDLRPHLKTAKCTEVARLAVDGHSGSATVSTLAEAEHFFAQGFTDLIWAVCAPPAKLDRAGALADAGCSLRLITDDPDVARLVAEHPAPLRALIEIDSGDHRTGVSAAGPELLELAAILGERLDGVLTHAGHSYGATSLHDIRTIAEQERTAVVGAAERLREAGWPCPIVSVGSTPTASHARSLEGCTELRPGVYVFGDLFQVSIGSCALDDLALSVLATVVSTRRGGAVLDAGGLALSKDRSTAGTRDDAGYGRVCDTDGRPLGEATVAEVHQEHGLVQGLPTPLRVGDRVRVLPNHACMTAAAHDRYHVVSDGPEVVAVWHRINGW